MAITNLKHIVQQKVRKSQISEKFDAKFTEANSLVGAPAIVKVLDLVR